MKKWLQRIKIFWNILTGYTPPEIASLSDDQITAIQGIIAGTHHAKKYAKRVVKKSLTSEIDSLLGVKE
jgi:hypothetical protein